MISKVRTKHPAKSSSPAKKKAAGRRTYAEMFLESLSRLSGKEQKLISNKALRGELKWDDELGRYNRVKDELRTQGKIITRRGYGGTVGLANSADGEKRLSVFISYAHSDEKYKIELLKHLEPLKKLELIATWHDREISAGDKWAEEILEHLNSADLILMLISIDFINSPYCYDVEVERALERHEKGEARIIPIILRSCMWSHTPFAKIQALPKDARAIKLWQDQDEAMMNVAEGIRQVAEQMLNTMEQ